MALRIGFDSFGHAATTRAKSVSIAVDSLESAPLFAPLFSAGAVFPDDFGGVSNPTPIRWGAFSATMMTVEFSSEPGLVVVNARHGRNRGGRYCLLHQATANCGRWSDLVSP